MKSLFRAALALSLLCCLLLSSLCPAGAESPLPTETPAPPAADALPTEAPAEDDAGDAAAFVPYTTPAPDGRVHYVGTAMCQLRVRIEPSKDVNYIYSISEGDLVYILILDGKWSKVQVGEQTGYVMSPYLKDVRHYDPDTQTIGEPAEVPVGSTGALYEATADFTPNFVAYAIQTAVIYEQPDVKSRVLRKIPIYDELICESFDEDGKWGRCRYNGTIGYIQSKDLFKFDRINPYAGDIPGVINYPYMIITKHSANIYEVGDTRHRKEVLKTVNPGAVMASNGLNAEGQYTFNYWRTQGYITEDDVAYTVPVVHYDEAQPGDLIAIMTTYYAVGVHTLNFQGRNWNIYLGGTYCSTRVLQPGETWNQYSMMGPYRKSSGYHRAPVANPRKLTGFGGGTCQVNTTMYNVLLQLPIYVNHRKVHADSGIYYVPKGFDAAVGGGDINMVFTNMLPYPIRFQYMTSDGVLTVCVFRDKETQAAAD